MKLETLKLVNYRGFEELEITFQPDVNVIAGVNGVGKSSVLHALSVVLSRAINQFTPVNIKFINLVDDDVMEDRIFASLSAIVAHEKQSFQFGIVNSEFDTVKDMRVRLANTTSDWENAYQAEKNEKDENKRLVLQKNIEALNEARNRLSLQLETALDGWNFRVAIAPKSESKATLQERSLPIDSVFLAAKRPFTNRKKIDTNSMTILYSSNRQTLQVTYQSRTEVTSGVRGAYNGALTQRTVELASFVHWYRALQELGGIQRQKILLNLREVIREFAGFDSLDIEVKQITKKIGKKEVILPEYKLKLQKNKIWLYINQLSDGERGIIALIFDLTQRLTLANPNLEDPISQGEAIVLIDEIELHLHPSWQRKVLRRLMETFKNCQFIVTTHSPQIIGEVEPRALILLGHENGRVVREPVSQSLGMDSSWILVHLMGTDERDEETQKELEDIKSAISRKDIQEARRLISNLEFRRGIFTALQASKSILDRLEILERRNANDN